MKLTNCDFLIPVIPIFDDKYKFLSKLVQSKFVNIFHIKNIYVKKNSKDNKID